MQNVERMNESDKPSNTQELMTDKQQLEWLWSNCNIVCWTGEDSYAVEHNPNAKKSTRGFIERVMHDMHWNKS